MRGVVVFCLIFLVLSGQEVNAETTTITTTETPKAGTTATTETPKAGTTATTETPKAGTTATTETPKVLTATTETPKVLTATTETPKVLTATTETPKVGTATTETPKVGTATTETPKVGTATTETSKEGTIETNETPKSGTPTTETTTTGTATNENPHTGTEATPESSVPGNTTSASPPTSSNPTSCAPSLCGNGATCLQLHQTYKCQCPLNYHYEPGNKTCIGGDGFFGEFRITAENFNSNPESAEYTNLYMRVMNQSNFSLFNLNGYLGTIIIQISLSSSRSQRSRRSSGEVTARVSHVFQKGATTADLVTKEIEGSLDPAFGTYSNRSICDGFYCDPETTNCAETPDGQGATCSCKEGKYSSPDVPEVTSCRDCSPECSPTAGKYCKLDAKTGADCACLPGYKRSGDACKECEFGHSGADCTDNYLLILVIVGAVLGAVVLALLGAVIGVSVSSKKGKKSGDQTTLIDRYETTLPRSSPAPTRIFPKVHAKPDLGEVNKAASFYDDNEEFSRSYPKRDYEEVRSVQQRPPGNPQYTSDASVSWGSL